MSVEVAVELKRTPLYECHLEAGAKLVPFAGWQMPIQYGSIKAEHLAVRRDAGLFDVSHMGEVETSGPHALEFLQAHLSNDLSKVAPRGAQYALLCGDDGGVLDDLITYRLPDEAGIERFLTVVNAANSDQDFTWLRDHAAAWDGVEVVDRSSRFAMLALQGPRALAYLQVCWNGGDPAGLRRFSSVEVEVAGAKTLVCRTGYTGEDGVELLLAPEDASTVWGNLIAAGVKPVGLAARDTLRLEACYPLYGNDLSLERTPIEAGLEWCCDLGKDFVGVETLREQVKVGTREKLIAFVIEGPGIARSKCSVQKDGKPIGQVTSGTFSPSLECGIGMAYVLSEFAQPDTEIEIDVRGKLRSARVTQKPLYNKSTN